MSTFFSVTLLGIGAVLLWRSEWATNRRAQKRSKPQKQYADFWTDFTPKPTGTPSSTTVMADVVEVATCDRHPSAVAAHFAVKGQALLSFCGHCGSRHELALVTDGWEVLHALVPVPVTGG